MLFLEMLILNNFTLAETYIFVHSKSQLFSELVLHPIHDCSWALPSCNALHKCVSVPGICHPNYY